MDTIAAIKEIGIPLAALIAIGMFIKRDVWPFLCSQIIRWQDSRDAERNAFVASLNALQSTADTGHAARAERDRMVADQLTQNARTLEQLVALVQDSNAILHSWQPHG